MAMRWDVERVVLAGMVVLILGGLGFIWYQRGQAQELARAMPTAEKQLAQIGVLTEEVQALQDEMNDDAIAGGKLDPYAYIERQLVEVRIGKTSFSIPPPQADRHEKDGYEDTNFQLIQAPQGRESFTREELALFLLHIEGNTTRMKSTGIRLERAPKAPADQDAWKARLTITDRRPIIQG